MDLAEYLNQEGDPEVKQELNRMERQGSFTDIDEDFFNTEEDVVEDTIIFGKSTKPVYKEGMVMPESKIATLADIVQEESTGVNVKTPVIEEVTREIDKEDDGIAKTSDGGGVSITPSSEPSEYRTDHNVKGEYRTKWEKGSKRPRKAIKRVTGLTRGEVITDDMGNKWTVTEKDDTGTVKVRNKDTGEEKEMDEEFVIQESMKKRSQGESNDDASPVKIPVPSGEDEEEENEGEKPDVTVEKELGHERGEPIDPDVEVGTGIYEDFIVDMLTDPEIAPIILEKVLRELENNEELLARIESAIPGGQMEKVEYWKKNGSIISEAIVGVLSEMSHEQKKRVCSGLMKNSDDEEWVRDYNYTASALRDFLEQSDNVELKMKFRGEKAETKWLNVEADVLHEFFAIISSRAVEE